MFCLVRLGGFPSLFLGWLLLFTFKCLLSPPAAAQPALVVAGEAAPGAEAVPAPGAATTTADPGPAPIPDPGPSLNPNPSPGPPDGARQSLHPGPGPPSPEVEHRLPTEVPNRGPAPNPRAGLNLQETTEQRIDPDLDI